MSHMFSYLFDSQYITSNLIFVKSCPTVSLSFYGQNKSKILPNLSPAGVINTINKEIDPPPPKKKTNAVIDKGGGTREGRTAAKD